MGVDPLRGEPARPGDRDGRGPVSVWVVPRPSAGGNVAEIRRDPYGLPDYQAQTQHVRQDATGSTASAAQRVIEQHLRARDPGR